MRNGVRNRIVVALLVALVVGFSGLASAQEVHWTMVTSWPSGIGPFTWAEMFAEKVEKMSNGRMVIDVHPAGALVGAFEVIDAVHSGIADAGHSITHYWLGKHPAFPFFASVPMAFETHMYYVWLYEHGGIEYWNRLYSDILGLNIIAMPLGFNTTEFLAWSHRPLEQLEDFRGLKYRTVGWWGEILRRMGVSVTTLPAAEVYPALERRVLDATEYASPWIDRDLGFYEVTKYFTGPGMHQPASAGELTINKDAWNRLPDDLKAIVETAAEAVTLRGWTLDQYESMEAFDFFKSRGNVPVRVSEEAQREFRRVAWAYLDELSETDPFIKEVWASVKDFYLRFVEYEAFTLPVRPKPGEDF